MGEKCVAKLRKSVNVVHSSSVGGKPSWLVAENCEPYPKTATSPAEVVYGVCKAFGFQKSLSECMAFGRVIEEREKQ